MRGKRAPKRKIAPDAVYNSELVSKLINTVMLDGKKGVAAALVYEALEKIQSKTGTAAVEALGQAIENVSPKVEVRTRRVGGANYPIPTPVSGDRQNTLAMRWIVAAIRSGRGRRSTADVLAEELMAAMNGEGNAIKKKQDVERMAEANKAFSALGAN